MSSLDVCGELAGGCEVEVIKCGVVGRKSKEEWPIWWCVAAKCRRDAELKLHVIQTRDMLYVCINDTVFMLCYLLISSWVAFLFTV